RWSSPRIWAGAWLPIPGGEEFPQPFSWPPTSRSGEARIPHGLAAHCIGGMTDCSSGPDWSLAHGLKDLAGRRLLGGFSGPATPPGRDLPFQHQPDQEIPAVGRAALLEDLV